MIFLVLILVVILVFLIVLLSRVGVRVKVQAHTPTVWVKLGVIRVKVYPLPQSFQKNKRPEPKQSSPSSFSFSDLLENDLGKILELFFDCMDWLSGKLVVHRLHLRIIFGSDDAAKTGMMLGGAFALMGMILPVLEQSLILRDRSILLDADFESQQIDWSLDTICTIRPIFILFFFLHFRKRFLSLYDILNSGGESL